MQKKRIVALGLSVALAISALLSGCGQDEEKKSSTPDTQTSEPEKESSSVAEEPELEPYTVTYWLRGDESKDNDMVMEAVNERIQELLPNTTLEIVWVSASEYAERWSRAMAAGEKVDIGWSANWVNNVENDVSMGVVTPIEDLLKEYGQGIVEAVGGWDVMDMHHSADGELYFMPAWQGMVGGREAICFKQETLDLMPEGWLEETQKIALENTDLSVESCNAILDRLEELLEVAKENDQLGSGVNLTMTRFQLPRIEQIDWIACVTEEDGVFDVFHWQGSEWYKAYNNRMHEWYEKGYVRADILTNPGSTVDETCVLYGTQAVSSNWLENECATRGFEVNGIVACENNKLINGFATGAVIPTTSEDPERAMQVLNLIYTDAELYQLLVYGIEGTHYTKNEDGTIARPAAEDRTYAGATSWTLGTCLNSLPESVDRIGYYEALKAEEANAEANPLVGFVFDSSSLETEKANLNAVLAEYDAAMYQENWEDAYKKSLEQFENAGLQTYLDEYRKQLKEYVEANGLGTVAP